MSLSVWLIAEAVLASLCLDTPLGTTRAKARVVSTAREPETKAHPAGWVGAVW